MKQKLFFLVGSIVLIALVVGVVKLIFNRTPKQGELQVESTPVASVFLDNKHIGRTPIGGSSSPYKLNPGEYTIKIVPDAGTTQYASWQGQIKIGSDLRTYVSGTFTSSELSSSVSELWLEKISGKKSELSVTTTPDSATVMLDDDIKGLSPINIPDLTPGSHALTLTSSGFSTQREKIQLTAGYRVVAIFKLGLSSGTVADASPSATITPSASSSAAVKTSGTPSPSVKPTGVALLEPAKPYVIIKDTPTGYLNVRMAASKTATKSAEVKPGAKYAYTEIATDSAGTVWYQIAYDATNTGWISGQYVDDIK